MKAIYKWRNTIKTGLKKKVEKFLLRLCLAGIILFFGLGVGNPRVTRARDVEVGPLTVVSEMITGNTSREAINNTLTQYLDQFDRGNDYRISEIYSQGGFAYATVSLFDLSTGESAPGEEFIILLARQDSLGNWKGIAPGLVSNRVFNNFLKSFPDDLIDESTRAFFSLPEINGLFFSEYKLPWPVGQTARVSKKDGSGHENQVDFVINSGVVYASKPGTVVFVKESSNYSCPYLYCWQYANMVVIQHSASEYSWYVHLAYNSVEVSVGDTVGFGKKIGIQGTTGYSSGDHLHFMTSTGHTDWTDPGLPWAAPWANPGGIIPVDFIEVPWNNIVVGGTYASQNGESTICYSLFVNSQGSGTAYPTPTSSSCGTFSYPAGMTVQLTAGPNAGWHFENWTGGPTGSAVTNYIVNKSGAVTAVFMENSLIQPPSTPPPPPASDWVQTFYSDRNLGIQCGTPRTESDVYMFRASDAGWSPPDGCPQAESSWSVRMVRSAAYFEGGDYSFGLFYDDRARLYIDDTLVLDGWSANQHYKGSTISPGNHELRLEYKNIDGQAILGLWWRGPGTLPGIGAGKDPNQWWVKYWGNQSQWADTVGFRNEGTGFLDRDWVAGGPGFGLPVDHFSTSYERTLGFECGTYQFHLKSDDGSRLFIDGTLVPELDHWSANTWDDTADVTLTNADHTLRVDQFDKDGNAYVSLDWSQIAACQPVIPARPANLEASDGSYTNKVSISWDSVPHADYYQVYRNTVDSVKGATLINAPSTSPFDDTSAIPGVTYYYRIKACQDTTCSLFSLANTGWRKLIPPTFVQASDGTYPDKISLNWTPSSGAASYRVYSSTTRTGPKTLLGSPTDTVFADANALPGVTYYYRIKACQAGKCSTLSVANLGWRKLEPPANLQASDGTYTDRISLTWTATEGATSYRVYRAAGRTGARILLGRTGDTSFDDISATPGVIYYYRVKACQAARCSNFSIANSGWRRP